MWILVTQSAIVIHGQLRLRLAQATTVKVHVSPKNVNIVYRPWVVTGTVNSSTIRHHEHLNFEAIEIVLSTAVDLAFCCVA